MQSTHVPLLSAATCADCRMVMGFGKGLVDAGMGAMTEAEHTRARVGLGDTESWA